MRLIFLPSLIAPVARGRCFGGAEMAALELAEQLGARGHEVVLYGIAGSAAQGVRVRAVEHGTPLLRPGEPPPAPIGVGQGDESPFHEIEREVDALASRGEVDAVHLHLNDAPALHAADRLARRRPGLRVVSTLHLSAVFPETARAVADLIRARSPVVFAAPSRFAASSYDGGARGIAVIPNGVDTARIRFVEAVPPEAPLAWAGRRSREKGLAEAIEVAARAGRTLVIAGPEAPEGSVPVPRDAPVRDLGLLVRDDVPGVLGASRATLVTSSIAEAHPLIALESLAAGTPVIAFRVGGLPEIVEDGVTGFLIDPGDLAGAAAAVERAGGIDRARCRRAAVERFDRARVVEAYERVYAGSPRSRS